MTRRPMAVLPYSEQMGDWTIGAEVGYDPEGGAVDVTIVISRASGLPPVLGEQLEVEVRTANGRRCRRGRRAVGPLVEAGGSLGMSSNAHMTFDCGAAEPAVLIVAARGRTVRFRVLPDAGRQQEESR